LRKLIKFVNNLSSKFFTGQLVINFYKGSIGKAQLTKTLKSSDLSDIDI
jgi:hypothetical protein